MRRWVIGILAMAILCLAAPVQAEGLSVGDPAPKLDVKEFVKGDPVAKFDKGKTYVVEFWATWCGPCRVSIPHLTEMQKAHKDATFIGVSVWENDQSKVKPFVEEMGAKMDYRVAMDSVSENAKRGEGKMAASWMTAAGQGGIPTAFIINGDGNIAWIGHPMEMEKPLEKVLGGTWDIHVAALEYKDAQKLQQRMRDVQVKIAAARRSGDSKQLLEVVDAAIKEFPKMETALAFQKYSALAGQEATHEKALEYGKQLVENTFKDNAAGLNMLAWSIVDPMAKKADAKFIKLALSAAQRADEVAHHKDPAISDTLAKAYFDDGDASKALEIQERAVVLAKGTPFERDATMKDRLEQYRKAVKK